jgi:hypothetical protein
MAAETSMPKTLERGRSGQKLQRNFALGETIGREIEPNNHYPV